MKKLNKNCWKFFNTVIEVNFWWSLEWNWFYGRLSNGLHGKKVGRYIDFGKFAITIQPYNRWYQIQYN